MSRTVLALLLLTARAAAPAPPGSCAPVELFKDDFSRFPPGWLSNPVMTDPRDEVILWDQNSVWIYTQDGPAPRGRVYAPIRNPDYNDSNYRANVSLPRWREAAGR